MGIGLIGIWAYRRLGKFKADAENHGVRDVVDFYNPWSWTEVITMNSSKKAAV